MKRHGVLKTGLAIIVLTMLSLLPSRSVAEHSPVIPARVFWGDTHLSRDAFVMGTRLTPEDAYQFAKGEVVRASGGQEAKLRRPLDFLMVADQAENMGVMPMLISKNSTLPDTEASRHWSKVLAELPDLAVVINSVSIEEFLWHFQAMVAARPSGKADYRLDDNFRRSVWESVIAAAEKHNSPGKFTTFIGYEWSVTWQGKVSKP